MTTSAASTSAGSKASEAVEKGLKLFGEKQYEEALRNFQAALESQPRPEESQAALYNSACCQIKLNQWQAATDSVSEAINNFRLPLKTAMEDKDLAPLRERREWRDAAENMVGGVSKRSLVGIRAEQKAPFRLLRIILSSGLGAGALLGLFIILSRLVYSLKGGEGAPDLTDTLKNLTINGAAVGVLGFIFQRDLKGQKSDKRIIEREEALARLQVKLGKDRLVTLEALRGTTRPVIVTGSKGQVNRALKAAEPYLASLRERGVSVIPVMVSEDDPSAKLAALEQSFRKKKTGFGKAAPPPPKPTTAPAATKPLGRTFEIEPYDTAEWLQWVEGLKEEAKAGGQHLYVQVQLDGSVRRSGEGSPPWKVFCDDLPAMDSLRTRITDGLRM